MEPTFLYVQGTTAWTSGAVTEFSLTSVSGAVIELLSGVIDLSSSNISTGPQPSLDWSAVYPVMQGDNSYEFIFGLQVASPADNGLMGLRLYCPNYVAPTGCSFMVGTVPGSAFTSPVSTISSVAVSGLWLFDGQADHFLYVSSPANIPGGLSDPIYIQVQTNGEAQGGNQPVMPQIELSLYWN